MNAEKSPSVWEKIRGCLYGGAAGDALGYPVEFLSLARIRHKYGYEGIRFYDLKEGVCFSDDTQMLLFTLEGLINWQKKRREDRKATVKNSLFAAYRDWYYTQEHDTPVKRKHAARTKLYAIPSLHRAMAPGITCLRALRNKRAGSIENPLNDSKGNGGVMRVAPVGFHFSRDEFSLREVMMMGAESAAITHGHPLGWIASAMMAGIVNECVYGDSKTLTDCVLLTLKETNNLFAHIPETKELDALIAKAIALSQEDGYDFIHFGSLGNSMLAESALAIAVYCALKYENDFDGAIAAAVNFDGDSDTVAAIAGNILGAWKGISCIDEKWIKPLDMEKYLSVLEGYENM